MSDDRLSAQIKEPWEIKVAEESSYHFWDHRTERERLEMAEPRTVERRPIEPRPRPEEGVLPSWLVPLEVNRWTLRSCCLDLSGHTSGSMWSQSHFGRGAGNSKIRRKFPSPLLCPSSIPLGLPLCRNSEEVGWQMNLGNKSFRTKHRGLNLELRGDR